MSINATRIIRKRIIFKAKLVLTSAAVFSNGDSDPIIDMMILRDSCDPQKALLPGSSLAGALRSYLEAINGKETKDAINHLFGYVGADEDGEQSRLLISDAVSSEPIQAELRDGVRIDNATRTAADQAKYDLEVLPAGTCFSLELEFIVLEEVPTIDLLPLVVQALHGLQTGQISLGMKKNRGLGQCSVKGWDIYEIDMTKPTEIFGWLERDDKNPIPTAAQHSNLYDYFGFQPADASRYPVTLKANFTFADDAMLIRSAPQTLELVPDTVHLQTRIKGELQPVIPGTSWAGVLRHRALRILNTLKVATAEQQLDELFGFVIEQQAKAQASRIMIKDSLIQDYATEPLVQNRIAIDRFTGGAFDGALFSEMPVWKTDQTCVTLEISIKPPRPKKEAQQDQQKPEDTTKHDPEPTPKFDQAEVGLLLLLLKDLWTGDLAVGGTSSIGRGRLQGLEATLTVDGTEFCFKQATDGGHSLEVSGDREQLKKYVEAIGAAA